MKQDLITQRGGAEPESRLIMIEQQIALGYVQVALGLKTIRDEQLYVVYNFDSMQSYCLERLKMSPRHMHRHLQIADAFGEKVLGKIAKSNVPMNALLAMAKDQELAENIEGMDVEQDKVVYSDGTFEPLSGVISRALEREKKNAKKKLDDASNVISSKEALLEDYKTRIQEEKSENEKLKKVIQELTLRKDIDPGRLVFITQKREAMNLLDESSTVLVRTFGNIGGIPHELLDAELTMRLAEIVASIEAGVQRIREEYGPAVFIPDAKMPSGFIPE